MDYGRETKQRKTTFNLKNRNRRGTQESRGRMEKFAKMAMNKKTVEAPRGSAMLRSRVKGYYNYILVLIYYPNLVPLEI